MQRLFFRTRRSIARPALVVLLLFGLQSPGAQAGEIQNIKTFLDQCPTSDPIYSRLRSDIQLRRNGVVVGAIPCTGPISQLPVGQYTDELIAVQSLRTMYYMDRGQSGHLSWTPGPLYDWFVSRVGGIDIRDDSGSYCCETIDGRRFFVINSQDDENRSYDKGWRGISGNIDLYAHEARHADGFEHSSCCGIIEGCDDTFDSTNPSSFAIQYLLNKYWLEGTINVGISCLSSAEIDAIAQVHQASGDVFRRRFCSNAPPTLTIPDMPGGPCALADAPHSDRGDELYLSGGNPNPFRHSTRIDFVVPERGHVTLRIYDITGRQVGTLADEELEPGSYSRIWKPIGLLPGAYFYRIQTHAGFGTKQLVLLK